MRHTPQGPRREGELIGYVFPGCPTLTLIPGQFWYLSEYGTLWRNAFAPHSWSPCTVNERRARKEGWKDGWRGWRRRGGGFVALTWRCLSLRLRIELLRSLQLPFEPHLLLTRLRHKSSSAALQWWRQRRPTISLFYYCYRYRPLCWVIAVTKLLRSMVACHSA